MSPSPGAGWSRCLAAVATSTPHPPPDETGDRASLCARGPHDLSPLNCFCLADALMKKAFSSSAFNSNAFLTRLLIHMGLLKVRQKERGPGGGVHPNIRHLESCWGRSPTGLGLLKQALPS